MKYRIIRGRISLDGKKYGIGDIIEMEPEQAERLPSNSVVQVSGGVESKPAPVYEEPEPVAPVKPTSTGSSHKPTTKKD